MITVTNPSGNKSAQRYEAKLAAQGYYAENFPRATGTSGVGITGSCYFMAIGLLAGDVVSNILMEVLVAGATFSAGGAKCGLYTKGGVQLAVSLDVNATFATLGPAVVPMVTPYTVPTTDGYMAAFYATAGTMPNLARNVLSTGNILKPVAGASMGEAGLTTGNADLTTPQTILYSGALGIPFWVGVS